MAEKKAEIARREERGLARHDPVFEPFRTMDRFVEEMDYREVADIIGKSVPAVRVIQHRALGNLRKIMMAQA